jgi:hypothetical protein
MATLTSTTIRTALVDYRAELLQLTTKRPGIYGEHHQEIIAQIDAALLGIEGNVCSVLIQPLACNAKCLT